MKYYLCPKFNTGLANLFWHMNAKFNVKIYLTKILHIIYLLGNNCHECEFQVVLLYIMLHHEVFKQIWWTDWTGGRVEGKGLLGTDTDMTYHANTSCGQQWIRLWLFTCLVSCYHLNQCCLMVNLAWKQTSVKIESTWNVSFDKERLKFSPAKWQQSWFRFNVLSNPTSSI